MLVLKYVLDLVQHLVLQGGKSSNQTSTLQTNNEFSVSGSIK